MGTGKGCWVPFSWWAASHCSREPSSSKAWKPRTCHCHYWALQVQRDENNSMRPRKNAAPQARGHTVEGRLQGCRGRHLAMPEATPGLSAVQIQIRNLFHIFQEHVFRMRKYKSGYKGMGDTCSPFFELCNLKWAKSCICFFTPFLDIFKRTVSLHIGDVQLSFSALPFFPLF